MSAPAQERRDPSVARIRRARKARRCSEGYHTIQPGERYLYAACPPWDAMNSTRPRAWWVIAACLRCADSYQLHTSETRAALAAAETREGR